MKTALKLMRLAQQALADADHRMLPSMDADAVNIPLHRSAAWLDFAIAAAEDYLAGRSPTPPLLHVAD